MLDLMRRKAQSPYIQATIVIIILVFVFWGVGSNQGPGRNNAATVNGQAITYRDFQQAYERTTNRYRKQFGGSLPDALMNALNLRQQVINQLIERELLLQGAQQMGLRVSDEEIRKTVQTMGSFQDANGTFDVGRYKEILASSRMTPANFEASIRTDLLTDKVVNALGRFAQVMPEEVQNRFTFDYETTTLAYLAFTDKDFTARVKVTDEELAAFYDAQKDNYKTEPQKKLSYLFFSKKDGASQPTDAEIKAYYEQNLDTYNIPEQRHARHILLRTAPEANDETKSSTRKQLEEILAKARSGADFAELAKKYSEDGSAANGGDLGFFGRGQMVPAFDQAVFALKEGALSDIVETQFGFHIIKVEKIKPARQRQLAEVKDAIVDKLATEQGGARAFKAAGDAYEKIILAGSLQKYAQENKITVHSTDFFTRSKAPKELADKPSLLTAAFSLNKGELSSLVEDHNGYSILYIEDGKIPEVPPLASVRDRVVKDFIAAEATKLAEKAAQDLLTTLQNGGSFAAEANTLARTVKTATYSRADRSKSALPPKALDKGLELSVNTPTAGKVIGDGSTFYVLQLQERKAPAAEQLAGKETELRGKLLKENRIALLTAWIDTLKRKAEISINQQLLEQ